MHLTPYPKLARSECRLDAASHPPSQRSSLFVSQQGPLLRTCSSNHGNTSGGRLPLSVICTNTLSLRLKAASGSGALQPSPLPYGENDALGLYQAAAEEADAPMDIWTVIKPGHVREKIAIFASDAPKQTDATADRNRSLSSGSELRTPLVCASHTPLSAPPRATKAKGIWEETCNAKRRRRSGNRNAQQERRIAPQQCLPASLPAEEVEPQKVSVGEMVAFLEQRANEQQPDSKPVLALQRSSTTITLSRPPPFEARQGSEVKGEEPENLRVSDMVAKLESECLRRRAEGELSRSNSLRRTVGRVLLVAAAEQSPAPSPPSQRTPPASLPSREPASRTETMAAPPPAPRRDVEAQKVGAARGPESPSAEAPPPQLERHVEEEPLPGLLFLSSSPAASLHTRSASSPHAPDDAFIFDPAPSRPRTPSCSQSERKKPERSEEEEAGGGAVSRRASVSQDFLEMRQRLQQLLEPQPLLAVLPHHLLVKIFLLLPTQSLAALKCTCHYFKFIIENYGVRPADSLWVSDPRYRDDPCKQCKRRYGRGDVSLCRWHHKPYCQALPYGPGYWMCCHGSHRDAPGCNVGLHDNRWVPAFHSINVPIYRRSREDN